MYQTLEFDPELIRRYDASGPRYTSYPTAVQFSEAFDSVRYRAIAQATNTGTQAAPLSLYFHIPFCDTVCFYCACNKVITKNRKRAIPYLEQLFREIEMQGALFDRSRPVDQLHWGGGTPTFLSAEQMRDLMRVTGEHFQLRNDDSGEYSIEIDPREADAETIAVLRSLGFNRLSLGIQDFDPDVQKAVNRIQTEAQTWAVLDAARAEGFKSVSVDLIYGLPLQTVERFMVTLDKVIAVGPDRLSVFNYAHLPQLFKTQRQINEALLPSAEDKLAILELTIERLTQAGYLYIGMDHFARPDDELAVAQRQGTLYRNFQGYSTHADCDLVAMGATAISKVGNSYSQNLKALDDYAARIDSGELAVFRGVELNADDVLRREVITRLICNFELDFAAIEMQFGIDFKAYFVDALRALEGFAADGLLELGDRVLRVRPRGRLLIRNICMQFDRYLKGGTEQRFSKVI
jgi:oxygen-independent coproporphyrinogen-3 oxidase